MTTQYRGFTIEKVYGFPACTYTHDNEDGSGTLSGIATSVQDAIETIDERFPFAVNEVTNLEFVEVLEVLQRGQWAAWLVTFEHDGRLYEGELEACSNEPDDCHHDTIENCQLSLPVVPLAHRDY